MRWSVVLAIVFLNVFELVASIRPSLAQSPNSTAPSSSAAILTNPPQARAAQADAADRRLFNKFHKKLYPLLTHPDKGCVDCHNSEGTSSLVLTGNSTDDFHTLLDDQYLKLKGVDTLLSRVATRHDQRRMPKDADPWSSREIQKLRAFVHEVEDAEQQNGVRADEQFPRSLLSPYRGEKPAPSESQFLTYRQLQGKVRVLFEDDWVRGERDLFAENLAMFGGADFKTRFNESSQPTASFLIGLEMLARDVSNRAFETQQGPFRNWPNFESRPSASLSSENDAYRSAITQLYLRILYRPPNEQETLEALSLLCRVFELEDSIQRRDDELGFELTVQDPETLMEQRRAIQIPVSGDRLQLKQILVDQSIPLESPSINDAETSAESSGRSKKSTKADRQVLCDRVYLDSDAAQRLVIHNIGTIRNVSFAGLEILDASGTLVQTIEIDSPAIELEGAWQIENERGFRSYEDREQHKGASSIRVALQVPQPGEFQIAMRWRRSPRNANNVLVELYSKQAGNRLAAQASPAIPPIGEAHFTFDCSNDTEPFASPGGLFQFDEQSSVEIHNRGTIDTVTAAAVGFVNAQASDPAFLVDSKEAEGHKQWKSFDSGRFRAYNTKGTFLHDDNSQKGELSLSYQPRTKKESGWKPQDFYRLRVYFPGKKDQESQVPLIVRAAKSSPIIQLTFPRLAKADCTLRIDASSSYTVSHSRLEYLWKQVSGTRVVIADEHASSIEFKVPRRSVEQAAWTALCSALMRHPDFLFTRPPSLLECDDPATKDRLRLVKLALDLVGRPPTRQETDQLTSGTTLQAFTDRFLDSQEFRDFYHHRIRLNLESQGTEVQDEPVRLWSYVAINDRPFSELLTANYTVNREMQRTERPLHHGRTGILTTPGFIQGKPGLPHYNYAAQVSMLFLGFVYEVPAEIVDQRVGVTALGTTDPNSVCYSCHKILTPLAFQRLEWNDDGVYRTKDDDGQPIDASDQNASEDYPFPGKGMEAFTTQAVKKERFIRTIINTHVNFYFGRPMRFRDDERVLYKRLWDAVHRDGFKIRSLIREIVNSPEYLN
ncbi:MAG: hypothetical protein ABL921_29385 [Pirellula sp.]